MIKHSASHGCATLVCTAAAGIIVYLLHRFVPDLLEVTTPVAAPLAALLGGIPFFTLENVQVLLLAGALALVWGVAFKRKIS
jgi:hypothetical protein